MYKIQEEKIIVGNKEHITYGIWYNDSFHVENISADKTAVEKLVQLCNDKDLDPIHLYYMAEDFVNGL